MSLTHNGVVAATRAWIERAVIGLNLCPFAKAVYIKEQIRYVVSPATTPEALLEELTRELQHLVATPAEHTDTTLLIHPSVLNDFPAYNPFLDVADTALQHLALGGVIQIASFHPQYQFAGSTASDVTNCTNRSPFPMLHLLREASVDRAVAALPEAAEIYQRNIATMRRLGWEGWERIRSGT